MRRKNFIGAILGQLNNGGGEKAESK